MRRAHEAAHREIEAGRAVLALVVTVRRKFLNLVLLAGMLQHMRGCAIDFPIPSPAFLIGESLRGLPRK